MGTSLCALGFVLPSSATKRRIASPDSTCLTPLFLWLIASQKSDTMLIMPEHTMLNMLGDLGPNGNDDDVMTMGDDGGDDDVNGDSVL